MPTYLRDTTLVIALVLFGYSALLIRVVVFKDALRLPIGAGPGREERVDGERPGPGRGAQRGTGATGDRDRRGRGPAALAPPDTRRSRSRFAPLHANYVPFKTILPQLRGRPRWSSAIINLVGNTVLFVPVGFLVPCLHRRMTWRTAALIALAVGVSMEVTEGVLRVGIVDVDDLILNALGVMSGYWAFRFWERRKSDVLPRANAPLGAKH